MEKLYLFNVYTFCRSQYFINVGPHMVYYGDPIYISYIDDQMWLVMLYTDISATAVHRTQINQQLKWTQRSVLLLLLHY